MTENPFHDERPHCATPDCGNLACWCYASPYCNGCLRRLSPKGQFVPGGGCMHREGPRHLYAEGELAL